ncbi:hypothetical protein [Kitasatospora sp. SUK 42]|uniref:hypothetical protein n=1 Tax=Kitasatospora sp. SUK 42 TaxID=1588882 RepID=UPI001C317224|nr:hypothetical protein [Kitasatospora sp. SUK 42]MBV2156539.1 hypothetical protein [Kitasatospora sp. SUK 42]
MTRTALLPWTRNWAWTGRGTALCGVLLLLTLQGVAVGVAPGRLRLFLSGVLIGASTAGLLLALLLAHSQRRASRPAAARTDTTRAGTTRTDATRADLVLAADDDTQWFSARSLEGFPMEQVRPILLAPGAPGLNRLYTAWIFATHGHDPQWIAQHLDLPTSTARLLATAARRHTTSTPSERRPQ